MSSNPPERLTMIALGIRGDQPLDPEQPPLVDGVHLRWAPDQDLGFPWYGFYLFRRETRPSRPRCLKKELTGNPPRPGTALSYATPIGTLSSAKPLVFTDDFPEPAIVEADLGNGLRFDLPPGVEANRVDVTIGFREQTTFARTCVDFRRLPLGSGPTPRTEEGAVFTVRPVNVITQAPDASVEQWNGGPAGLEFTSPVRVTYQLDIALPCRATQVDLLLSNRDAIAIEAFEAGGASAGVRRFDPRALQAGTVTMTGKALERLTIESTSADSALLHEVCWVCPVKGGGTGGGRDIRVDFTARRLHEHPNPVVDQGVTFESHDDPGTPAAFAWFEDLSSIGGSTFNTIGLWDRGRLEIRLPCSTTRAEMFVTQSPRAAAQGMAARMTAFNQDDGVAQQFNITTVGQSTVVVEGQAITRIQIDASHGDVLLHTLAFRCPGTATQQIKVRALGSGNVVLAGAVVSGTAGDVVRETLLAEAITAVEIDSGNAALIDLCYVATRMSVPFGWEEVPGFQYPLCLPVAQRDYPCSSKPANPDAARNLALSRVTYPSPASREQGFWKLHRTLAHLVRGGPGGGAMADRIHPRLRGRPHSPATQESPSMPDLKPLDLVFLASLHPAYAQMLGLYFVDRDVPPDVAYDYLILADPTGVLGGSAKTALDWLAHGPDASQVHAELVLDRRAEPRPPIAPPRDARAYALPGAAAREVDGSLEEVAGNVGLWWPLAPDGNQEEPDRIIFYEARRAFFGATRPAAAPDAAQYQRVLGPLLVSEPDPPAVPVDPNPRSSDWPPPAIAMHAVDGNLAEGWYSYRLAGQDLFGRRSVPSLPAEWYQWDPPAGKPAPWYWKSPAGHRAIDAFAVGLLDKVPPPAPLGVEAWALDPLDRWLFADAAYDTWRATVSPTLVGLRVRWRWTLMQQIQEPDTAEFRVYQQPGRWNALLANVEQVSAAATDESDVELDVADAHASGAFAGARLRIGHDDFAILGSQPGSRLRLRVKNIGALDEVRPAVGKACTIAIPDGHPLHIDTSVPPSWVRRLAVVPYEPAARTVIDATKDANGKLLTGEVFDAAPLGITGDTVRLPSPADLSGIQPWIDHLWLEDAGGAKETRRIVRYDAALRMVTLETAPSLVPKNWIVGRPAREYELFLPAPDVGPGQPFEPTAAEPVVYAQIAVSAADGKVHAADTWPGQPLGNRIGNESPLSPSATVYRVLQTPPLPPELPDLPDRLFATHADFRDRSYSTFRFLRREHHRIHVLRALDDTLFQRDWLIRETRKALDPAAHADFFPDAMSAADRAAAATALNAITAQTDYTTLTAGALQVLALLPGNEGAPSLAERDRAIRGTRQLLTATDNDVFPASWTSATRTAAAVPLNAIAAFADYEALPDNALRILAGLPGNEAAFTQQTIEPLDMNTPSILDERRPDDAATYTPANTDIRAYTDTLPGRATNRYFYRAAFVDRAQNISALSLAGPPVYLHKVEPPRAPVITRVVGGDRQITIEWAANRERDVKEYRVYRAEDVSDANDSRRMAAIATVPSSDPELHYTDSVVGNRKYFYRIVAITDAGLASPSSAVATAMAYEATPPEPAVVVAMNYDTPLSTLQVAWRVGYPQQCLLLRRDGLTNRVHPISAWMDGTPSDSVWNFEVTVRLGQQPDDMYAVRGKTRAGHVTQSDWQRQE